MKFAKLLARMVALGPVAWRERWIAYKALKKLLHATTHVGADPLAPAAASASAVADALAASPAEVAFFERLGAEVRAVAEWYCEVEAALAARHASAMEAFKDHVLKWACSPATAAPSAAAPGTIAAASSPASAESQEREMIGVMTSIARLYTACLQLENYAVINYW